VAVKTPWPAERTAKGSRRRRASKTSIEAAKSQEIRGQDASPCCGISVKKGAPGKMHRWRSTPAAPADGGASARVAAARGESGAGAGCTGLEGALYRAEGG
jgi:hypothetical protein